MTTSFWVLWGFDALIALVVLVFFFWGLVDGSVSAENMGIWVLLLFIPVGILLGSIALTNAGHPRIARVLLWLLATPGIIAALYLLLIVIFKPRWN